MGNRFDLPVPVPMLRDKLEVLYRHSPGLDGRHAALGRLFRSDPADPDSGISGKAVSKWVEGEGSRDRDHVPAERWPRLVEIFRSRLPGRRSQSEVEALLAQQSAEGLLSAFMDRPPAVDWLDRAMSAPPAPVAIVHAPAPGTLAITTRSRPHFAEDAAISYPTGRYFRFLVGDLPRGWLMALQWDARRGWFGLDLAEADQDQVETGSGDLLPASRPFLVEHDPINRAYFFLHTPAPFPPALAARISLSARGEAPLDAAMLQRLAQQLDMTGTTLTRLAVAFRR